MFSELVKKTRTYRRYDRLKVVTGEDLDVLLDCVRYTPSAGNLQRIRYITVNGDAATEAFGMISLGGYLPAEQKPDAYVAPAAYIVMLTEQDSPDTNLAIDIGISAEAIVLAAAERGIGSCIIRNFNKEYFEKLATGTGYHPALVIALGYPAESIRIVEAQIGDSLKYYRNGNVNFVPKLKVSDLVLRKIQ